MKKLVTILLLIAGTLYQCEKPPVYPDEPQINYESFSLFYKQQPDSSLVLRGRIDISFTDGDGNIGFDSILSTVDTSSVFHKSNLFLQTYDYNYLSGEFEEVTAPGGLIRYRIPTLDRTPLSGTISVFIDYAPIVWDTVFYTIKIYDRDLNESNMDTTDVIALGGL